MGIALGTSIRFFENGVPVVNGSVYFYEPGTTTLKTIYTDSTLGTPAANPLTTNENGEVVAWGTGKYKIRCENASAALVDEEDNVDVGTASPATVTADDGTAGAPSYSFSSDTDTGVFLNAADQIGVSAGSAKVLTVRAGGLYAENNLVVGGLEGDGTTLRRFGQVNVSDEVVLADTITGTVIGAQADAIGPKVSISDGVTRSRVASYELKNGWTKGEYTVQETVTAAATTALDADESNSFYIELTTNITTFSISNLDNGQTIRLLVKQDSGGGNTISWPAAYNWPGGTAPTITAAASAFDLFTFTGMSDGAAKVFAVAEQNLS